MTYQSPPPPPPQSMDRLGSIKTYILIAWIFSLLSMIGFLITGIYYFIVFATVSAFSFGFGFFAGVFIIYGIVLLVFAVFSFLIFMRVSKMRRAANSGDIATLKATSNMMWAILALIFAGVLPGIMLIIADGPIKQL